MTCLSFFFFNDTATTEIYTLSLHDALPISVSGSRTLAGVPRARCRRCYEGRSRPPRVPTPRRTQLPRRLADHGRSEEHTSELQSRLHLVCRLLLEKKKKKIDKTTSHVPSSH